LIARDLPLYSPSREQVERTRLWQLITSLQDDGVIPGEINDAHSFQRWSVENIEPFWAAVWRTAGILADGPGSPKAPWKEVLVGRDRMAPPVAGQGPSWFTETRLNFAEHLLRRRDDAIAITAWSEEGRHASLTFAALSRRVAQLQAALVAAGVRSGDRVAGWMPNIPDTVATMLAASSIGAIWSSCSPDFGTQAVLDRFTQIAPRILIAASGYRYAGKAIDCMPRLAEIVAALPSVEQTWVVPYVMPATGIDGISNARLVDDVLDAFADIESPTFTRLPFDHPLYILYSSGTTGLPKCIVHGAGGTLLQHWKEHALHTDLSHDDRLFYYTTCGWMMWNWLVSALAIGTTIVLYDGAPLAPDASVLWRMAEEECVTVFGTSARYLATCEKEGLRPGTMHDLTSLRAVLSTGSPLAAHSYDYVYRDIKRDLRLASISGGTDIVSCFALGDPTGPVYRGELQMRGLGMAVEVFDERGRSSAGTPGELVCTRPFPSMPVAFWNDPDHSRYHAAYFAEIPGVWRHGDWAEITSHDGVIIHGRSDSTLNPGGVRIGTAEIYRQVEQFDDILESVVIEYTLASMVGESRIALFVRMRDGRTLDDALRKSIRTRIRDSTSPHHVPRFIVQVADIPRTVSGKISELAVREAVHGREVKNADALANPGALALYHGILKD
jgi:acetoacetyl-CoA synthetase